LQKKLPADFAGFAVIIFCEIGGIFGKIFLIFEIKKMPFINFNSKEKLTIFPGVKSAMEHSGHITYGCVEVGQGVIVPEHRHPNEQWTYIIEGQMEFTLNGEKQLLQPGMGAFIPSNELHGALAITACKIIDVFTPVREDYKALGK
jgi:quercetin dioxygenase-like cupin family protein